MPLVSITRLRVRSWRYFPMFFVQAVLSARQSAKADGNLKTKVLRDQRNTYWTSTVWTNDAAMKEFMLSGVHRRVMRKLLEWCDEAALVHWTQRTLTCPPGGKLTSACNKKGGDRKSIIPRPLTTPSSFLNRALA